jgi:antibiotic biosynthesis monooxygenase (ABM) superfamily enzyme
VTVSIMAKVKPGHERDFENWLEEVGTEAGVYK